MTLQGQPDRPPPLEGFDGQFVLLLPPNLALPALPEGAVPGVALDRVRVLTDVLPDRCEDVVVPWPASVAPALSAVMMMTVFLPASHAASDQTRGLQLIIQPAALRSSPPSVFLVLLIVMLVVVMVVVVVVMMTMYWTVISSNRLLHHNILGIAGFPCAGNGVPLLQQTGGER